MTPPKDKAREAFEDFWFAYKANGYRGGASPREYAMDAYQAALASAEIKLPERKAEPTTQTADNVDEWRFVRTWNRVIDEVKALNGVE